MSIPPPDDAPSPSERSSDPPFAEDLDRLRKRIVEVDDEIIRLIGERRQLVLEVGALKAVQGRPVLDPRREAAVVRNAAERARAMGVDEEMARDVIWRIIAGARAVQEGMSGAGAENRWRGAPSTRPDPEGGTPSGDPTR